MAEEQVPFTDVQLEADGLWLPELKWRELLFVGALRREGESYVRDPARPLPAFAVPDLFPAGASFVVQGREGGRVRLRKV
jgi:hypothetical protein